jgi:hypothetical protein
MKRSWEGLACAALVLPLAQCSGAGTNPLPIGGLDGGIVADTGAPMGTDGSPVGPDANATDGAVADTATGDTSAPPNGDAAPPADGGNPSGSAEQICVDTINMYRATLGLPPYARWTSAEMCADGQAQSDSQTGTAHGAFGMCSENAQNECPGWPGPPDQMIPMCLAAMWSEGPGGGHYDNMSSTMYTQTACGFYTLADGSVWAVQDFQ